MTQSVVWSFSARMAGFEVTNEKSLFANLDGCRRALQLVQDYHTLVPAAVGQALDDLSKGIDFCASITPGDAKKLYNIVLEKLYELKAEYHLPLKLYFNQSSPYWECFRFNIMEIRAVLCCCCGIPKLPILKFERQFVDFDRIFRKRKWGPFVPDSPAVDRYLAHLRAEKRREKLRKMLIEDEHPKLEAQSSNSSQQRKPLILVKQDSDYFRLKIGSKSVSSTKKRGQKTLPQQNNLHHQPIRSALREMQQALRFKRARAVQRQYAIEEVTGETEDYF